MPLERLPNEQQFATGKVNYQFTYVPTGKITPVPLSKPDFDEDEDAYCDTCDNTGESSEPCDECRGWGTVNCDLGEKHGCKNCEGTGDVIDDCRDCS